METSIALETSAVTQRRDYKSTGAVSLTFDDGWWSEFLAYRIAGRQGIRGTIYYVASHLGNSTFLTADQLRTMADDGWEIGSHTVTHPHLAEISRERAAWELRESKSALDGLGLNVTTLAYPYGDYDARVATLARKYYVVSRTTRWSGFNDLPPTFLLRSRGVDNTIRYREVKRWIDDARAQKKWLILVFHEIIPSEQAASYQTSTDFYRKIIRYLASTRVPTPTVSEVVSRYPPTSP